MVERILPDEAKKRLEGDAPPIYLDVRSTGEFEAGHVPGAYNIPLLHKTPMGMIPNQEFTEVVAKSLEKGQPIICGCAAGARSYRAAEHLTELGYEDVVDMQAGFHGERDAYGMVVVEGWAARGYPVATDAEPGRDYESLKNQ